jgi:hypothetical protein
LSNRGKSAAVVGEVAMIAAVRYPSLFQINTRVWLTDLARRLGRPLTLDDIPDEELDRLADLGFDWIWLLSVWQTGPAGRRVSRSHAEWLAEFHHTLPDLQDDDIAGSGFAITGYTVDPSLGGDAALARLRTRLHLARHLQAHLGPPAGAVLVARDSGGSRPAPGLLLMNGAHYDRAGGEVVSSGLYVDLRPWGYHVFDVTTA